MSNVHPTYMSHSDIPQRITSEDIPQLDQFDRALLSDVEAALRKLKRDGCQHFVFKIIVNSGEANFHIQRAFRKRIRSRPGDVHRFDG